MMFSTWVQAPEMEPGKVHSPTILGFTDTFTGSQNRLRFWKWVN